MKVRFQFKTPEVVDNAIGDILENQNLDSSETQHIRNLASKFVRHEEFVKLELDTETGFMEVLRV